MKRTPKRTQERGQVLVLFVGGMVGLLAFAALAIDLSSVYSTQQTEKAAADAAALAGAQNLQVAGSRAPGNPTTVRTRALEDLAGRFGVDPKALSGDCNPAAPITKCLLLPPYVVAISTGLDGPSKTPTTSDPFSVQVTVSNPNFQLSFARLFGQNGWNVGETSVAVLANTGQYAVITLRPPNPNPTSDSNFDDVLVNGGSTLNVYAGDVGTNSSMNLNGSGSTVALDPAYHVRYYDATAAWGTTPLGKPITSLIPDPKYPYPLEAGADPGAQDIADCAAFFAASFTGWYPLADPTSYTVSGKKPNVQCWKPGIYTYAPSMPANTLTILEPGVFFFDAGLDIKGSVVGGIEPGTEGVSVIVPQSQLIKITGTPPLFALNMGSFTCSSPTTCTGTQATPATWSLSWSDRVTRAANSPVVSTTKIPLPMSIVVPGILSCTVTVPAPDCSKNGPTIDYRQAGTVAVAGEQYAPSDNAKIAGNGNQYGYQGQIVSWTITYTGGSSIGQHYGGGVGNAVVRLDTTCSGGGSTCNP